MKLHAGVTVRRVAVAAAVVAVCATAVVLAPVVLRGLEVFQVREVEVVGTRLMDPYTVVRAAGLDGAASVFDDADRWRYGVLTLPLVERVEVRRRLPGAVEVRVHEVEPVALVASPSLRPVDAAGSLLPVETAGALLDLPLLTGVDVESGRVTGARGILDTLVTLRRTAPELAERVSQLDATGETLRVTFREHRAEALLPAVATEVDLRQLRLAMSDLTARGELGRVQRIDLRFRDQVVVSFLTSPVS